MRYISLILFLLLATPAQTGAYPSVYVAEIVRVYDGDTFTVNISSYPEIIGHEINVRVAGIDTPEIRGKCAFEKAAAKEARKQTEQALLSSNTIQLLNVRRDKYFRLLADVSIDNIDLGSMLISKGMAVYYDGGTKHNWCAP